MGATTKKLLSNSGVVFLGTLLASVFSYLFNMLMGRMLGPVHYGEMTALMSLLMILSVAGGALTTIAMRYSGELYGRGDFLAMKKLLKIFTRYIFYFALVIFLLGIIFIKPLADFFSLDSLIPLFISLFSVFGGLLVLNNKGFLQGNQLFLPLSFVSIFEMACRLALGVILVKIGFALNGALLAMVAATIMAYLISFVPLMKSFKKTNFQSDFHFDRKEIINYSWPTLIATIFLVLAINLDILLVKHYFSPEEAGLYSAISTIGKIILYLTAPVITVMFPMISEQQSRGEKHYRVFLFSLILTLIAALAILAVYVIAPGKVISILYGQNYVSYFYLLPEIGLAVLFYSLANLLVNYYLAVKKFAFLYSFALILLSQVIIISFWHPSILAVVRVLIFTFALLFVLIFSQYLLSKKSAIAEQFKKIQDDR